MSGKLLRGLLLNLLFNPLLLIIKVLPLMYLYAESYVRDFVGWQKHASKLLWGKEK